MHKVLVNRLFKLAQEKSVARLTDLPNIAIAVDWDLRQQTKPKLGLSEDLNIVPLQCFSRCKRA